MRGHDDPREAVHHPSMVAGRLVSSSRPHPDLRRVAPRYRCGSQRGLAAGQGHAIWRGPVFVSADRIRPWGGTIRSLVAEDPQRSARAIDARTRGRSG
jgi:hypothetical protein